jgi:hypothetical protein
MKRNKQYYYKRGRKKKRATRRKKRYKKKKRKTKKRYISSLYRPTGNEDFSIRESFVLSREQELVLISKPGYPVWMIETGKQQSEQRVSAGFTLYSDYKTVTIQILFSNDDLLKGNTVRALKTTVFPLLHPIYGLPNTLNYNGVLDSQTVFEDDSDTIRKTEEFALQVNTSNNSLFYDEYKIEVTKIVDHWLSKYVGSKRGSSLKGLLLSFTGYNFLEWMMWVPVPRLPKVPSKLSFQDWVEVFLTRQELQRRDLTYTFLLYHPELLTESFINEMSFPSQSILFPDDRYAPVPNDILLQKISIVNDNKQEDPTGLKWPGLLELTSLPLNSASELYKKLLQTGNSIKQVIENSGYSKLMLENIEYSIKQVASLQSKLNSDNVSPSLYQDISTYFSGGGIKQEHLKQLIEKASQINKNNYLTLFLINLFLDICLELLKLSRRYTQFVLFYYPTKSTRVDIFSLEQDGKLQLDKLPLPKIPLKSLKSADRSELDQEIEYLLDYLGKLHRLNRKLDEKEPFISQKISKSYDYPRAQSAVNNDLSTISAEFEKNFGSSPEAKFISSTNAVFDSDAKKIRYALLSRLVYDSKKIGQYFVVSNDRRALYEKDMILAGKQLVPQLKQPSPISLSPISEHLLSCRSSTMAMFAWLQEDDIVFGDKSNDSRIESFPLFPYVSKIIGGNMHYGLKNDRIFNPDIYSTEYLPDAFNGVFKDKTNSLKTIIDILVERVSLKYTKNFGVFRYVLVSLRPTTQLGDTFVVYSKTDQLGAIVLNPWFHLKLSSLPQDIITKVYRSDQITFTYLSDKFIEFLDEDKNGIHGSVTPYNRFSTGHLTSGNLSFSLIDMPKTFAKWIGHASRKVVIKNFLFPIVLGKLIQPDTRLKSIQKVEEIMRPFSMSAILKRIQNNGRSTILSRKMVGIKESDFYNNMSEVLRESLDYILSPTKYSDSRIFRFHREAKLYQYTSNKTSNHVFDENRIYLLLGYNKQFTRTNISSFSPTLAIMYGYTPENSDNKMRAFIDFYLEEKDKKLWTRKTRLVSQGKEDELIQSSLWYFSYPLRDLKLSSETIIKKVLSQTWKPGSSTARWRENKRYYIADYDVKRKFLFAHALMLLNETPPKVSISEPLYDSLKENNIKSSAIVKDILLKDKIPTLEEINQSSSNVSPKEKNRLFFSKILSKPMQDSERLMAIFDDEHDKTQNEIYITILKVYTENQLAVDYLVKVNYSRVVLARTIDLAINVIMEKLNLKEDEPSKLELISLLIDKKTYKQSKKNFLYR